MSGSGSDDGGAEALQIDEHKTARGELLIWLAAPTVMVFKYTGHSDASYATFCEETVKRVFGERNGLHFFVDCEDQTGFDAEFRERIAAWGKQLEPRTLTYCVYVKSRVVALGITVGNLIVGGKVRVCSSRKTFRAVLDNAVRRSLHAA